MTEKFVIYFGFPSTDEMLKNVENFASNTDQSLEDAWIDLLHKFIRDWKPNDDHESFIESGFSSIYDFTVIPPPFIQQKYPKSLGETIFRLPCLAFMDDCVTAKETGGRIKISDEVLEELCYRFRQFIDTKYACYEWCS
jgi:hypothetical protein